MNPSEDVRPWTAARWERVSPVLEGALACVPHERAAHLNTACAGDAELRSDVERLLAVAAADLWLDQSAAARFGALLPSVADHDDDTGRQIGVFRLLNEVGRGGMGVVYRAERADKQYEQQVALKLIKRGMDTDFVIRRFQAERQILASLTHPNIARLLDGGTTSDGRPYFAMEYIEGQPIDRYAREHNLDTAQRLRLFLPVCDALSYAHQQLVVHRDLKPLNILVTQGGVPKLLDFGIGRILADDAAGATATGVRALTPEYASPEQIEGRRAATASDVYSLGVVLYELLTGALPYTFHSRAPEDVAAAIRTTEPPRPSTRVSRLSGREQRGLRGDVDTIVLMALRKEPERRYASVEQFAADLRRHLTGMPVMARPDTLRYRTGKFVRRNTLAVAAASAVVALLLASSAAVAWQARIATRNAARATRRFADLRALAHNVLFDYHDAVSKLPGATPVRQRFVTDGLEYLDKLSAAAADDSGLRQELGAGYRRLADVQGGSAAANLGDTRGAIASYRKSLELLEPLVLRDPRNLAALSELEASSRDLGLLLRDAGDLTGARAGVKRSIDALHARIRLQPTDQSHRQNLIGALDKLGQVLRGLGDANGARAAFEAALSQTDSLSPTTRQLRFTRRGVAVVNMHVGQLLMGMGQHAKAAEYLRSSLATLRTMLAEDTLDTELQRTVGVAAYLAGATLAELGRYAAAESLFREDATIARAMLRADPSNATYRGDLAFALVRTADTQMKQARPGAAVDLLREAIRIRERDVAADAGNLLDRASLIEAKAKLGQAVALTGGSSAHVLSEAVTLIAATRVDTADVEYRSFLAETYVGLASGYLELARRGRARAESCRNAASLLDRANAMYEDLLNRRLVGAGDSLKLRDTRRSLDDARRTCARLGS